MGTVGMERSFLAFPPGLGPPPFVLEGVGEALRGFRFLRLEPSKLRVPSDRAAPTTLEPDGSNLPTALAALAPEIQAEIRADLARLVPSFKSFDVVAIEDEFRIEVELTSGQSLSARLLSDGTLRLLALFLLLRSARPGALIAIEEPENGVHPGGLRALVEEMIEATTPHGALPPQVLLNSHSPALPADPESDSDPKKSLREALVAMGARGRSPSTIRSSGRRRSSPSFASCPRSDASRRISEVRSSWVPATAVRHRSRPECRSARRDPRAARLSPGQPYRPWPPTHAPCP